MIIWPDVKRLSKSVNSMSNLIMIFVILINKSIKRLIQSFLEQINLKVSGIKSIKLPSALETAEVQMRALR